MENRSTLTFIAVLIIIGAIEQVMGFIGWQLGTTGGFATTGIIRLTVILLIIQDGALFKSKLTSVPFVLCLAVLGLGTLLKIMHLYPASALLLIGFSFAIVFYTARFLLKKPKAWMDFLKWGWVVTTAIALPLKIFHWPNTEIMLQLSNIFLLGLQLAFLRKIIWERSQLPT